jgi:hypothetical protein
MGAFKHRHVARQKPLTDTTEQAQEIAAPGPNAFHGVGMDFANTITVIIARPLAASGRVTNRLVTTATRGEVLIGRPFIGGDDRVGARLGEHEWFQRGPISPFTEVQADLPTAAPDDPYNRWAVGGPSPVAARLVGSPARWVSRISVFATFLFGVLIQFIGFCHWIGQGCGRGKNAPPQGSVSRAVVRGDGCD